MTSDSAQLHGLICPESKLPADSNRVSQARRKRMLSTAPKIRPQTNGTKMVAVIAIPGPSNKRTSPGPVSAAITCTTTHGHADDKKAASGRSGSHKLGRHVGSRPF